MASYRVLRPVGPWLEPGKIITDQDLAEYPGLGGAKNLVEKRGCIEPCSDGGIILPADPAKAGLLRVRKPGPLPAKGED